eukprot:1684422-Karenia_brevis.AAC.1
MLRQIALSTLCGAKPWTIKSTACTTSGENFLESACCTGGCIQASAERRPDVMAKMGKAET